MLENNQYRTRPGQSTSSSVKRLALMGIMCNTRTVPDKEGTRVLQPDNTKAHKRRNAVFLRVYVFVCPLWVAVTGRLSGLLVFFCVPVCKPCYSPLTPILQWASGSNAHKRTTQ